MKTAPMKHQLAALEHLAAAPTFYALGAEQGTGKTWMLLADLERQWLAGSVQGALVIAPKGVHINWTLREIPTHMSCRVQCEYWLSGGGVKRQRKMERLLRIDSVMEIPILTMNVDAVNTKAGFDFAQRFLRTFRSMMIVDESQRIKNPAAKRTKRVIQLGQEAVSRRISSGTLVSNSPMDLFSQYDFLSPGLLGTTSYRAFVAEYADLLPPDHPLLRSIGGRGTPQVVRKDEQGRPVYRNLDKLSALMKPHTYRVTKAECLDLPAKIYQTHWFELEASQQRIYQQLKEQLRFEHPDGTDTFTALTIINKLRQVTSGFILRDGEPTELAACAPRMQALEELVNDCQGSVIIWASFREELRQIAQRLRHHGVVEYHGGTSSGDRERAVDEFQRGNAKIFIGNPAAAGTGLTLHAAETVIYYSSSYSLEQRLQSEDRAHRIGTKKPVVYIDLVATNTIDERIAAALQSKTFVAQSILSEL